jgi:hypothetical protein
MRETMGLHFGSYCITGLRIRVRIRMDPHYFRKVDPDLDLH